MRFAPFIFAPLVAFCQPVQRGPERPREAGCCQREPRSYDAAQANPFGAAPGTRLPPTLHCLLRFEDGVTEEVALRVRDPYDVVFEQGRSDDAQCGPCSSRLRLRANLKLSASEHQVELAGDAQLVQIAADSHLEFRLQQGELRADGVLVEGSKYVRISRGDHVIARAVGPCMAE